MKVDKEIFFQKMFNDLDCIMSFCDANFVDGWHGKELFQIHQLLSRELQKCWQEKQLQKI